MLYPAHRVFYDYKVVQFVFIFESDDDVVQIQLIYLLTIKALARLYSVFSTILVIAGYGFPKKTTVQEI